MNRIALVTLTLLYSLILLNSYGQTPSTIPFNSDWQFAGGSVSGETIHQTVTIPHTWNKFDAQEGMDYYRGDGTYAKLFTPEDSWKEQRVFVRFEGVMTIAQVYLNDELLGEHHGGYSAFIFELTDRIKFDQDNVLKVVANNEYTLEVLPLFGDFNIYGGMYRPVNLIVTPQVCISPRDYASPGIFLKQSNVSESSADIEVVVKISNGYEGEESIDITTTIFDMEGAIVESKTSTLEVSAGESEFSELYTLMSPNLWDGKRDPYLYSVKVDLKQNGKIIHSLTEPLGLRYFKVDPFEGFYLNGKQMQLNGVSRHQDREDKGSALSYADHKQDMEIMLEMGINALRLAHYQHSETIYDLSDTAGIVVWAELPWVGGPGSIAGGSDGYEPTEEFHNNAKQQLYELIRQNYNHPSIIFWSIFNEIQNPEDKSPVDFIQELNDIVKAEDPSRLSVGASMLDPEENIHHITDAIAWNRYFGWYYKEPSDIGKFLDETHQSNLDWSIGISEYGAGGSIVQHSEKLEKPNPFGSPHPEEWQSYYHEEHLKAFNARPFVWGTFLWNMFDFGSYFRREGDHYGINDKGLVTFDRKTKKDAFYFYKANWSDDPVLHITSKRHLFRKDENTTIKIYSNLESVTLSFNGEVLGSKSPVDGIVEWDAIVLDKGNNGVKASGTINGETFTDVCTFVLDRHSPLSIMSKVYDMMKYLGLILIIGAVLLIWLWYRTWRNREKTKNWKRIVTKILFFLIVIIEVILIAVKILLSVALG